MRHGRAKAARKTLKFFAITGNIVAPFKILLDGNFIVTVLRNKVPIVERLEKLLQGEKFHLLVTRSSLNELDALMNEFSDKDEEKSEIFRKAKQFGLDECEIIEEKSSCESAGNEISSLVSERNSNGYFVATQDEGLSDALREMSNVPIIRLSRTVLLLESPSSASRRHASGEERSKLLNMNEEEKKMLAFVKEKNRNAVLKERKEREERRKMERVKPKAKGPNPLSCKKRKTEARKTSFVVEKKKRRRRKKGADTAEKE